MSKTIRSTDGNYIITTGLTIGPIIEYRDSASVHEVDTFAEEHGYRLSRGRGCIVGQPGWWLAALERAPWLCRRRSTD